MEGKEVEKVITLENHSNKKVYLRKNPDKYVLKIAEQFVKKHFPDADTQTVNLILNETSTADMEDENDLPIKEINIGVRVSISTGGPKSNSPIILVPDISENDFTLYVYDLNYYSTHKFPKYVSILGTDAVGNIPGFVAKYLKGKDRLVYM